MLEGEIGHRIEIQIVFEYMYIFVVTFYLVKRERLKEKKFVTRERRIVSAILDRDSRSVFPNSIFKKCRKFVSLLLLLFILFEITNIIFNQFY